MCYRFDYNTLLGLSDHKRKASIIMQDFYISIYASKKLLVIMPLFFQLTLYTSQLSISHRKHIVSKNVNLPFIVMRSFCTTTCKQVLLKIVAVFSSILRLIKTSILEYPHGFYRFMWRTDLQNQCTT